MVIPDLTPGRHAVGVPDVGAADPALATALRRGSATPADRAALHAALVGARVLVPLIAVATSVHTTEGGLVAESTAEMALMTLELQGARALPVFSSLAELTRWRAEARPIPMSGPQACRSALEQGAVAVVLDPAGAALTVTALADLARGWVPVAGAPLAVRSTTEVLREPGEPVDAALVAALQTALRPERLDAARLLEGAEGLVLGVVVRGGLEPAALAALSARLVRRLGASLPAAGLDITVVERVGPGVPVLTVTRRGWRR